MMKMLLATAVTGLLAMPAFAGGVKYAYHNQGKAHPTGNVIHVSCYRGPWNDVIWDRPNSVFVDSLVAVGYDFSTAHAVAGIDHGAGHFELAHLGQANLLCPMTLFGNR